jgi:two-component system phosphate regulon sensor histidine kinase PhoR
VANYFDKGDFTKTVDFYSSLESSRRLSAQMVPYFDEHYLLIIRDITEMHNINQIRRDFVANASHELRTPLTVIVGYLEYILDNMETAPKSWHFLLNQMNAQSGRMINIINDLLELSTLERDELEEVEELIDINKLTLELYHSAIALSHGQHQISMDVTQEMTVFASYKSFNSSFTNLITNAIRYTPEGGEIHIRCYYDEDGLYFEVKDTGIGIAREDISRITERFYRANTDRSRQTGGTGLGLSIVKHALERYNGRLEITSRLQVGSTFRCVFPASLLVSPETHPELFAKKA